MAAVGFNRVWGGLLIACNSYQIQSVKFKNSLILKFLIKRNPLLWNLKIIPPERSIHDNYKHELPFNYQEFMTIHDNSCLKKYYLFE